MILTLCIEILLLGVQPMPSNYYAAPQYPQYASAASGAPAGPMPVYASAAGPSGGAHSQHDALAGVKVLLHLLHMDIKF